MKVIPPVTITDAMLTSSTAAEPSAGETAWVSGGTYAVGDLRIRTSTHRVYEALTAHTGVTTLPEVDATNWLDVGPTNKWAMFDTYRTSATEVASPLTVVITPGMRIDALALMGCVADSVTVTMTVSAVPVYTHTQSMLLYTPLDWYDYFFGTIGQKPSMVLFDLPPYSNGVLTVTLTRASGNVECGALVIGTSVDLGTVLDQPTNEDLNFSSVDRDTYGDISVLVPRRTVPKISVTLHATKAMVDVLRALRKLLNAVPAVWCGLDAANEDGYFEALLILGIYKEFSITLGSDHYIKVNLQLEEI